MRRRPGTFLPLALALGLLAALAGLKAYSDAQREREAVAKARKAWEPLEASIKRSQQPKPKRRGR